MKLRQNFTKGAGMLAVLGVIGKVIGVFYRLPLTVVLGAEGMGLYQLIFPLYSLILAVSCGGIPTAISKYISELNAAGGDQKRAFKISVFFLAILSFVFAVIVFAFAKRIAYLQGNEKAGLAYLALAPAIVFSAIISCFRGYFQGRQNMLPSGISQIIEQAVKVVFGLTLAFIFMGKGVEYGVMGAIIGISISEFLALAYLAIRFKISECKAAKNVFVSTHTVDVLQKSETSVASVLKAVYLVALPVTLGSLVVPLSQVMDSFLVVNLLVFGGENVQTATSMYGIFNGPVGSLINMPSVITVALGAALLPKIAYKKSKGQNCIAEVDGSINALFAIMIPISAVFTVAPAPIIRILYSGGLSQAEIDVAASVLRIEGINVFLAGVIHLSSAIMQAMGRVKTPVVNLLAGVVIKTVFTLILVPKIGIYGAAISNLAFYLVTAILNIICATRKCGKIINAKKQATTVLCAFSFVAFFMLYLVLNKLTSDIVALFVAGFAAMAAYLMLLIKTKCILFRETLL